MVHRIWSVIPPVWKCRIVFSFALIAAISSVAAQSPSQILDRADLLQNAPPISDDPYDSITGTDSSHAAASPNDPDLGEQAILKRQERYRPFTASVAAPFFYTSNVALTRTAERSDVIFAPAFSATYAPRLTKTLFATFSVGQQQFYYDRFNELNFGSFDGRAGLSYVLPRLHDLLLRVEYNYNRLTEHEFDSEFYSNHSIAFSAELPFRIGRAQQVGLGVETNVSVASDPQGPRRHEFDGYVGYTVNLTRSLTASAVARIAVRDYVAGDRTDVSEILGLTATYRFTKWLSASATSTLASNQSNQEVFDYDVANVGAALSLVFRF